MSVHFASWRSRMMRHKLFAVDEVAGYQDGNHWPLIGPHRIHTAANYPRVRLTAVVSDIFTATLAGRSIHPMSQTSRQRQPEE